MSQPRCKHCGAPIMWSVLEVNGRRVPLDPQPSEQGNVVKVGIDWSGTPIVQVFSNAAIAAATGLEKTRWTNHLQTCPKRQKERRR